MHASKHFDPQVGIDIHLYVFPPIPAPIPLPTPNLSLVFDPFDYIPFIGGTVHINGVKRTTAGSGALAVHIPLGPWVPPHGAPMGPTVMDTEVFMGSMTVVADGDPLSRITMPALDCNIVGLIFPFRLRKPKKPHLNLALPTSLNLAIPNTVMVGGPPMISIASMLFKGAFAGLGALRRTKAFGRGMDAFKGVRQRVFKNMDSGFLKCKVLRAEPVDVRDGSVSITNEDFAIPGRLPLTWTRRYRSNDPNVGVLGQGWHTPADTRLEVFADGTALFHDPAGSVAVFPSLPACDGKDGAVLELVDGARLWRLPHDAAATVGTEALDATGHPHGAYEVRMKDGLRYRFSAPAPAVPTTAGRAAAASRAANDDGPVQTLAIERLGDAFDNAWTFERRDGALVRVQESGIDGLQGRFLEMGSSADGNRLTHLALHDPGEGRTYPLVHYGYDAGGGDTNLDSPAGGNGSPAPQLTAVYDALKNPRRYAYRRGYLVRHTDRNGLSFHYEYDAHWRVVHSWGDGGLYDYRFAWHDDLAETEVTDSLGHVTLIKFDEQRLPLCEIDPLGGCTFFEYDEAGRTTKVTEPGNLVTSFEYDERGNCSRLTRPDGSGIAWTYDEADRLLMAVDPMGAVWHQVWGERGELQTRRSPLESVTSYEHDNRGLVVAHRDALEAVTRIHHDRHGFPSTVEDASGAISTRRHDGLGRLVSFTSAAAGGTVVYDYDAKGRLRVERRPDGRTYECLHGAEDELVGIKDAAGRWTRFRYCGLGQLAERINPDGTRVRYEYDSEERVTCLVNEHRLQHRFLRDALGRVVRETDYWDQPRSYEYSKSGHLRRIRDALGRVVELQSDLLGRTIEKRFPRPERPNEDFVESIRYDAAGNAIELRNPHSLVLRDYDAEGRLLRERQNGFVVENAYDRLGQRTRRKSSAGNTVDFGYDISGQLVVVSINGERQLLAEHTVDGNSVTERLGQGLVREFSFAGNGQLARQSLSGGDAGRRILETRYGYDSTGNLAQRVDLQQSTEHFRYDPADRLLDGDSVPTRSSFCDAQATAVESQMLRRAANGPRSGTEATAEWSRHADLGDRRYAFDRVGNLVSKATTLETLHLTWDADRRLVESSVRPSRAPTTGAGRRTTYGYDVRGRRIFKRDDGHTTWFYWDDNALLAERVEPNTPCGLAAAEKRASVVSLAAARADRERELARFEQAREYVYRPGGFVPLLLLTKDAAAAPRKRTPGTGDAAPTPRRTPTAALSGTFETGFQLGSAHRLGTTGLGGRAGNPALPAKPTPVESSIPTADGVATAPPAASPATADSPRPAVFHYVTEPNGAPTRITDREGNVVWAATYTNSGQAQIQIDHLANPLRLQGQYQDAETGLHYNLHRYFCPVAGQFVTIDPLGLAAGSDPYLYAPNPLGYVDPLGLDEKRMPTYMPTRQAYQRQHLIPYSVAGRSEIFDRARMNVNSASNMMYLPMFPGVDPNPLKGLHNGFPMEHRLYNEMVEARLARLSDLARLENWDYVQSQRAVLDLQHELRHGFNTGRFTCA